VVGNINQILIIGGMYFQVAILPANKKPAAAGFLLAN
jgi:hypothetical protein